VVSIGKKIVSSIGEIWFNLGRSDQIWAGLIVLGQSQDLTFPNFNHVYRCSASFQFCYVQGGPKVD